MNGLNSPGKIIDFKGVYYGTRCLLQHCDPYNESSFERFFRTNDPNLPSGPVKFLRDVTVYVNLPTTFLFIVPFAILPWWLAHPLWTVFIAGIFVCAALLMWNLGARYAPRVSAILVGVLLANLEILFGSGNAGVIVVGACVIAVWSFLEERFTFAGVLCLAVSLVIKPHDAGLVWLYFLLAGGVYRKRALQTLAVTIVISLVAGLWVWHVAPHWLPELLSNISLDSAHGGLNDPGPDSLTGRTAGMVVDLQGAVSMFRDDPHFYNLISYLVCGPLLLVWVIKTLKGRPSHTTAWLAIAAVVPLTMLISYHRTSDAKLLLLTIPACTMLWVEGRPVGKVALALTAAGFVLTADIPLAILVTLANVLHVSTDGLKQQLMSVVLTRPASLILLVIAIFYLWAYWRCSPDQKTAKNNANSGQAPAVTRI
jgi:hypothetical protein